MERDRAWLEQLKEETSCETVLEHWAPAWRLDRRESSRRCRKYRREKGEILLVNHEGRGWWDPCSDARGDVLGLIRHLCPALDFIGACDVLRGFAGLPAAEPELRYLRVPHGPSLSPAALWHAHLPVSTGSLAWRYLHGQRAIPASVLEAATRAGVLREGPQGTAWFAHRDDSGAVVGIEMRGPHYRGFSRGGAKTLFGFHTGTVSPRRLAVAESAIDALSLAALEGLQADTLYLSTAGGIGPHTKAALSALMTPRADAVLMAATDADAAGDKHAVRLCAMTAAHGMAFARLRPQGGKDWNEILLKKNAVEERSLRAGRIEPCRMRIRRCKGAAWRPAARPGTA